MQRKVPALLVLFFIILILTEPAAATQGMLDGIGICIRNLIPSLFPLFFFVGYLSTCLTDVCFYRLQRILRFCKLSEGTESIFLMSLISGYPISAASIRNLTATGSIEKNDGKRLMAFCNNAGPAFIFGMGMHLFSKKWVLWIIWGIQILASLLVATLVPKNVPTPPVTIEGKERVTASQIMQNSIKGMSAVCGWVLIFRVITVYLELYLKKLIPSAALITLEGLLEMSNGSNSLMTIENDGLRFVLFSIFLSFGGLCVWLQIKSAAGDLMSSAFVLGKFLHVMLCTFISMAAQLVIFRNCIPIRYLIITSLICLSGIFASVFLIQHKFTVANQRFMLYNNRKKLRKEA